MLSRIANWLDDHADPDWRVFGRLWSVQVTVFWGMVAGLWAAIPAFQNYLSPERFAELCIGVSVLIALGRLGKQPGI
jgi:hypothetical protein